MPNLESLSVAVVAAVLLGKKARELTDALQQHLPTVADDQRRAELHHIGVALNDFALAIGNAESTMTPAVRDAIAAR